MTCVRPNSTRSSPLTPLFCALPSIFVLSPLSAVFTHCHGGVGVSLFVGSDFTSSPACARMAGHQLRAKSQVTYFLRLAASYPFFFAAISPFVPFFFNSLQPLFCKTGGGACHRVPNRNASSFCLPTRLLRAESRGRLSSVYLPHAIPDALGSLESKQKEREHTS
jgi:hypothetical protein